MARVALVNLASLRMPGNQPIFPLGIERIRQVLQIDGHEVEIIDFCERPELQADHSWVREGWDVVGLTIRNIDPIDIACESHVPHYLQYTRDLQNAAGDADILWVGGGPGFSLFATELTEKMRLAIGVVGPGETVMSRICADVRSYSNSAPRVLTGVPDPGFDTRVMLYSPALMEVYTVRDPRAMIGVETRRKSCYQGCTYCPYAHITKDDGGTCRTIPSLIEEIRGIYAAGFRRIFFTDGIFNAELRFAKDVVAAVKAEALPGLQWSAYFTPKPFDEEFAELLSGSGNDTVIVSPDSLDPQMMNEIGKSFDVRHVRRFLDLCRAHALNPRVSLVIGGPFESEQTVANTMAFVNDHLRDNELALNVGYRVLPETAMSRQTEASTAELLEPTFLEMDPQVFQWIYNALDSRFLTTDLMLNVAAAKHGMKKRSSIKPKFSVARKQQISLLT
ncbi:B12-binding domain-containing radical SAM protein [Actinoplanes sp. NPDC049668]|uniref:B12-binding domain-containing radical SAM protein n=1 Tax=unclassified Actinoplanes TaxID=2626549 RepID=UPI0033AD060D